MAGLTTTYEAKTISHFLRNSVQAPDAALYIGLFTTAPANDGTGGVEVTGGGYARQAIAFAAAANGQTANSSTITFTASATAPGFSSGTAITHFGIFNAVSSGTLLLSWPLAVATTVGTGSQAIIAAGAITVTGPANMTTTYKNKFLEHFFRNNSQAPDATIYFGLYQSTPNADGTGGVECPAGWYARKALTFGAPAGSPETSSNAAAPSFVSGAGSDGGNISYGTIHNALTGQTAGVMLAYYPFNTTFSAGIGSTVVFPIGQLSATVD